MSNSGNGNYKWKAKEEDDEAVKNYLVRDQKGNLFKTLSKRNHENRGFKHRSFPPKGVLRGRRLMKYEEVLNRGKYVKCQILFIKA